MFDFFLTMCYNFVAVCDLQHCENMYIVALYDYISVVCVYSEVVWDFIVEVFVPLPHSGSSFNFYISR